MLYIFLREVRINLSMKIATSLPVELNKKSERQL